MFRLICLITTLLYNFSSNSQEKVNIYCWAGFIPQQQIKQFESEFGIKVYYDVFDSNEILDAKLMSSKSGYDIVCPSDSPYLYNQIKLGIYQKLDRTKLSNYGNLDSSILKMLADNDPNNQHAIPWVWTTTGIGYNKSALLKLEPNAPFDSLELMLNPNYVKKFAKCGVNWLQTPAEMISFALIYNGINPNNATITDLINAKKTLDKVRPYVKTFNSSNYDDLLAEGDICLTFGYSGDIAKARHKMKEVSIDSQIEYILPKEGFLMAIDSLAIPKDAPNVKNAYKFIDFLLRPQVAASASNYTRYINANRESYNYLDEEFKNTKAYLPNQISLEKGHRIIPGDEKFVRQRNRLWTSVIIGE